MTDKYDHCIDRPRTSLEPGHDNLPGRRKDSDLARDLVILTEKWEAGDHTVRQRIPRLLKDIADRYGCRVELKRKARL